MPLMVAAEQAHLADEAINAETRPSNNLPIQLTSFIGREQEVADVKRLLRAPSARLLTLTGMGGSGKTRLSLQAASELLPWFDDGVWLVELAPLADPALVPQAAALTLGVQEQVGKSLLATLSDYLGPKKSLLLLDNCEHVVAACAELAQFLLRSCPELRILATSREALGIAGEVVSFVPPLTLPNPRNLPPFHQLKQSEAVRLFVERAASVLPGFSLTEQNASAIAELCHRLDGIPLALELAAARVKMLPLEELVARLDDRFRLLTAGRRMTMPHHQTLRATMDWSYELLSVQEQTLFCQLSVFAGGWTLNAAEAASASKEIAPADVFDLLARLVDKSLVLIDQKQNQARFRMLETTRDYGREQLARRGEEEAARRAHCEYYIGVADARERELKGPKQKELLDQLESEHDNFRVALQWCVEREQIEPAVRLTSALWWFWGVRGHLSEARAWFAKVLTLAKRINCADLRAELLLGAGVTAFFQSDYAAVRTTLAESIEAWRGIQGIRAKRQLGIALMFQGHATMLLGEHESARTLQEESQAIWRELKDKWGAAQSLYYLGRVALAQGDTAGLSYYDQSLALFSEAGDKLGIATVLNTRGEIARLNSNYEAADAPYREALALYRELGAKDGSAMLLINLAYVADHRGDARRSTALFQEALGLYRDLGKRWGIAEALAGLASVASKQGAKGIERAARLLGAADGVVGRAYREGMSPPDRVVYDQTLKVVQGGLDEQIFAAAWAEGQAMTLEQAIAYCSPDLDQTPFSALHETVTRLSQPNAELALTYDVTIEGWSRALDLRDKETEGHTQRVTDMTLRLARAMGVSEEELVHVRRGALLHDIGKMGIPDAILLKPGALNDEEWVIMRKHPVYAYELLAPIAFLQPALDIPHYHHEKWDGTGYPRNLKGEQIPLPARMFAVVDVWDALRSDRPYRKGWTEERVREHIRQQSGKHFDPAVVDAFLNLLS